MKRKQHLLWADNLLKQKIHKMMFKNNEIYIDIYNN